MSDGKTPRRRRQHDRSEVPVSFLPQGNPHARRAYLCAVLGLVPGLGLLLGLPALVLGIMGRRFALRDPLKPGLGHSFVSRLAGSIEFACNALGLAMILHGAGAL